VLAVLKLASTNRIADKGSLSLGGQEVIGLGSGDDEKFVALIGVRNI